MKVEMNNRSNFDSSRISEESRSVSAIVFSDDVPSTDCSVVNSETFSSNCSSCSATIPYVIVGTSAA